MLQIIPAQSVFMTDETYELSHYQSPVPESKSQTENQTGTQTEAQTDLRPAVWQGH